MFRIGGADEAVVSGVHQIPDVLDLTCHIVNILLGADAGSLGLLLDLLAMLVGAGLEIDIIACLPLVPGNGISQHDLIGIADVGLCGSVGNSRGNIIGFLFAHG